MNETIFQYSVKKLENSRLFNTWQSNPEIILKHQKRINLHPNTYTNDIDKYLSRIILTEDSVSERSLILDDAKVSITYTRTLLNQKKEAVRHTSWTSNSRKSGAYKPLVEKVDFSIRYWLAGVRSKPAVSG